MCTCGWYSLEYPSTYVLTCATYAYVRWTSVLEEGCNQSCLLIAFVLLKSLILHYISASEQSVNPSHMA